MITYTIEKKATFKKLSKFIHFIQDTTKSFGFKGEDVLDVILMLEETLVNIISYAYPDGNKQKIKLSIWHNKKNDELFFEIKDSGVPFDVVNAKSPNILKPIEERGIGGAGIHIIKSITDSISYSYKDNYNILTLSKKRTLSKQQ